MRVVTDRQSQLPVGLVSLDSLLRSLVFALISLSVFIFCGGQPPHSEQPGQYFCSFRCECGPDNLSDSGYSSEGVVESTEAILLKPLQLVLQSDEDILSSATPQGLSLSV